MFMPRGGRFSVAMGAEPRRAEAPGANPRIPEQRFRHRGRVGGRWAVGSARRRPGRVGHRRDTVGGCLPVRRRAARRNRCRRNEVRRRTGRGSRGPCCGRAPWRYRRLAVVQDRIPLAATTGSPRSARRSPPSAATRWMNAVAAAAPYEGLSRSRPWAVRQGRGGPPRGRWSGPRRRLHHPRHPRSIACPGSRLRLASHGQRASVDPGSGELASPHPATWRSGALRCPNRWPVGHGQGANRRPVGRRGTLVEFHERFPRGRRLGGYPSQVQLHWVGNPSAARGAVPRARA
jgi:hypothetical protein